MPALGGVGSPRQAGAVGKLWPPQGGAVGGGSGGLVSPRNFGSPAGRGWGMQGQQQQQQPAGFMGSPQQQQQQQLHAQQVVQPDAAPAPAPAEPAAPKAPYGHLVVYVFEGVELVAKEGSGKGNPYVIACIDEDSFAEAEAKKEAQLQPATAAQPTPAAPAATPPVTATPGAPAATTGTATSPRAGAACATSPREGKPDEAAKDKEGDEGDKKKSLNRVLKTRGNVVSIPISSFHV